MILSLVLMFLTSSAHAQTFAHFTLLETCSLSGQIELQRPTAFFCNGDLQIADGTIVITHGHSLEISSVGQLKLGEKKGLQIAAKTFGLSPSGGIVIQATTASGKLEIDNRPSSPRAYSGDINLHFTTTREFHSSSKVGSGARVNASLNGQMVEETKLQSLN